MVQYSDNEVAFTNCHRRTTHTQKTPPPPSPEGGGSDYLICQKGEKKRKKYVKEKDESERLRENLCLKS